mgnify:CR=1 FL=1
MKKFTKKYPDPKRILLTAGMALTMIAFCGCGNSSGAGTTGSSSSSSTTQTSNANSETSSEAEKDNTGSGDDKGIIGGAADAVKDVADGVENTVSGAFGSFDDAQDWFMNQLPNENGRFEVANSDKDLTSFSGDRTGYHIELHDNNRDGDTKVGDFYIDSNNGKVSKSDEHGKTFAEYDFSDFK